MELELSNIYNQLDKIRISLRKLGPLRRKEKIGLDKIKKAREIYEIYKNEIVETLKGLDCEYIVYVLCEKIENTFQLIIEYSKTPKMAEKFDLREAASLIPVMDGKDETVERMVEGIEMLGSVLKEADNKKLLISYVLKTRLNKHARLKLKSEYDTVTDLVTDIKKYLIPKKSANSLLVQLNNITQNDMSIEKYAEKIEELFIDLTISQANDNPKASEILRPINESLAIKKFSDGLRNKRLGTVIAARNYTELKEAVQAAKDETLSSQPANASLMTYNRGMYKYNYNNSRGSNFRGYNTNRGNVPRRNTQNYYPQGKQFRNNFNWNTNNNSNWNNYRGRFQRGRNFEGSYSRGRGRATPVSRGSQRVFFAQGQDKDDSHEESSTRTQNRFFRD